MSMSNINGGFTHPRLDTKGPEGRESKGAPDGDEPNTQRVRMARMRMAPVDVISAERLPQGKRVREVHTALEEHVGIARLIVAEFQGTELDDACRDVRGLRRVNFDDLANDTARYPLGSRIYLEAARQTHASPAVITARHPLRSGGMRIELRVANADWCRGCGIDLFTVSFGADDGHGFTVAVDAFSDRGPCGLHVCEDPGGPDVPSPIAPGDLASLAPHTPLLIVRPDVGDFGGGQLAEGSVAQLASFVSAERTVDGDVEVTVACDPARVGGLQGLSLERFRDYQPDEPGFTHYARIRTARNPGVSFVHDLSFANIQPLTAGVAHKQSIERTAGKPLIREDWHPDPSSLVLAQPPGEPVADGKRSEARQQVVFERNFTNLRAGAGLTVTPRGGGAPVAATYAGLADAPNQIWVEAPLDSPLKDMSEEVAPPQMPDGAPGGTMLFRIALNKFFFEGHMPLPRES